MRLVPKRDNSGVMDHFPQHDDVTGSLEDLIVTVIPRPKSSDAGNPIGDATNLTASVFRTIGRMLPSVRRCRIDTSHSLWN